MKKFRKGVKISRNVCYMIAGVNRIFKKIFITVIILISSLPIFPAVPDGDALLQADALIRESKYDEALNLLVEYIKKNPQQFDAAQKRIRIITQRREKYNQKADELINLIVNQPENDEGKLSLISELESLEKNPNSSTQNFIEDTKSASQFTFYRSRFQDIFLSGREALLARKYGQALDIFNSGFFFYREEFNQEYPEQAKEIDNQIDRISRIVGELKVLISDSDLAVDSFINSTAQGSDSDIRLSFYDLKEKLVKLSDLRNEIAGYGWYMENLFETNNRGKDIVTESSFLPFAYRMILGRETSDQYEGLTGVLDSHFAAVMLIITESLYAKLDYNMQSIISDFESENFNAAREKIDNSFNALDILEEALVLAGGREKTPDGFFCAAGTEIPGTKVSWEMDKKTVEYLNLIFRGCEEIVSLNGRLENIIVQKESGSYIKDLKFLETAGNHPSFRNPITAGIIENLGKNIAEMNEILVGVNGLMLNLPEAGKTFLNEYQVLGTGIFLPENGIEETSSYEYPETGEITRGKYTYRRRDYSGFPASYGNKLEKYVLNLQSETTALLFGEGENFGEILVSGFSDCYEADETELNRIIELGEGVPGEYNIVFRYPREALEEFEKYNTVLTGDINLLEERMDYWISLDLGNFESLVPCNSLLTEIINKMYVLKKTVDDYSVVFAENVKLSDLALQEAGKRVSEAKNAMAGENYTLARERLQKARDKYTEAFELQESVDLRHDIDEELLSLGLEIAGKENDKVIKDVRNFIEEAKLCYYTGDFSGAEDILNRAKARWYVTHIEENAEITKWSGIVGNALAVNSGRTIPVTAPLYPEMSQLLSLANQFYEKGSTEIKNGNREAGEKLLNEALDKISDVKVVYPLNQEANLLSLKITKVLNPASFEKMFTRMYERASADYKNPELSSDCYNDLISLYEINPDYPGLKNLIYEVELFLGMRIPPVNETDKIKSRELTVSAEEIYNSKNKAMYPVALEQLDMALSLWADNNQAVSLKDRIQISMGGSETVILSSRDERIYKQAVTELQNGNTLLAASYVNRLLEKPENRKSSKVIALDERIKSLL